MDVGLYIHVPFCQSRCLYCDFFSTTLSHEWKLRYVDAVLREMRSRRDELDVARVPSLYIGGGTPSQLTAPMLARILEEATALFPLTTDAEVTVEANPDDVTEEWLEGLRATGVNRISMGVQTFSDSILSFLRRRHTSAQAIKAVELCRSYGYENISLDLIYGLPGQTMQIWQEDVRRVLSLGVPHLSAYSLSYEDGTPLTRMLENGEVEETSDDLSWQMYQFLMDETAAAGMQHYEISNFCKPGMHSRHNSSYWQSTPYLGFGPGAHSFDGALIRRSNDADLKGYVASHGDAPHHIEKLTSDERYDELVMTRLRTCNGLPLSLLSEEEKAYCLKMSEAHLQNGRLRLEDGILKLTREGIFVSNDVISDLMR